METVQTPTFNDWFDGLRDRRAKSHVARRIARIALGIMTDTKSLGDGVSELRINYGPGYRLYYTIRKRTIVVLLIGGDKGSQDRDIATAKVLAANYEGGE